jgi:M6 family metalloprotease-like protein
MKHSVVSRRTGAARRRSAGLRLGAAAAAAAALSIGGLPAPAASAADPGEPPALAPIDPQDWENPDDMTWDDYVAVPGESYNDPDVEGSVEQFKAAIVLLDFQDAEFNVTLPPHSTVFGNPQALAHDIPRSEVAEFYRDFLNTPNELNQGRTMHEYWMEDSDGRYGIDLEAFGPYRLPGKSHEYGLENSMNDGQAHCPAGDTCARNLRTDGYALWQAAVREDIGEEYDQVFWITAGQDESGTWQEFGPMLWENKEDVPDEWGPPDPALPNWAATRYVEWTSWRAAAAHWPNASGSLGFPSSTQAESSGMGVFAHEMSHLLGISDNYNNPFGIPLIRSYTGIYGMLSRGSFNGPGGPHTRWMIPPTQGSALGSQHMLRDKIDINLIDEDQVARLSREALDETGLAVVKVQAREKQGEPGSGVINGVNVAIAEDYQPSCDPADNPDCPRPFRTVQGQQAEGRPYNNFTLEVNQRIGADSFTPDTGVLLSMTKDQDQAPFVWIIDANPQDIQMVDFYRPDGTPEMITYGDFRQLSDAPFHAGTNSGSEYEYADPHNRLHFYVLDVEEDEDGVVSYTVAVRSTEGSGAQARGAALAAGEQGATTTQQLRDFVQALHLIGATSNRTDQKLALTLHQIRVREDKGQFKQAVLAMEYFLSVVEEEVTDPEAKRLLLEAAYEKNVELGGAGATSCTFDLTNTGAGPTTTAGHPEDASQWLGSDVYRLSASASGAGWSAELPNALATAEAGETVDVEAFVSRTKTAAKTGSVTLTAVSESDPSKTATATCSVAVHPDALT